MTRCSAIVSVSALCVMTTAVVLRGQGGGGNPEAQARQRQQQELEASTPKLQITEEVLALSVPGHTIGETEGVSRNSKGHLFVYSRTGTSGSSRGGTAAELFEFDENLKFVKMWGPGNYAASFAHAVRVDKYDNVWMVDEGSNMIVKFDPNAMVKMVLGRKPEAIDYLEKYLERGEKDTERVPPAGVGTFNRRDRSGLGRTGQHLRRRRLQQLARREARQGRQLDQDGRHSRSRRRTSSTPCTALPWMRSRASCTSLTGATSGSRCTTPT